MRGDKHAIFAAISGTIFYGSMLLNPLKEIPADHLIESPPILFGTAMCMTIYGSLLPDIDNTESFLGRRHPLLCSRITKHRGITHSLGHFLIVATLLILFTGFVPLPRILCFAIYGLLYGYLTHLFLDLFSHTGNPLFWRRKKYKEKEFEGVFYYFYNAKREKVWKIIYSTKKDRNLYFRLFPVKNGILSLLWIVVLLVILGYPLILLGQFLRMIIF